jgi:hypothetical protein
MGFGMEGSCTRTFVPKRLVGSGSDGAGVEPLARFDPNNEANVPGQRSAPNEAPFKTPLAFGVWANVSRGRAKSSRMAWRII